MAEIIQVLERHRNLIKVKYRGEFGYFWPTTNLTGNHPIQSFDDADQALLQHLGRSTTDTVLVPLGYDPTNLIFIIQVLDKLAIQNGADGEVGTFNIMANGDIKNATAD
ncbi:hypothetical protein [Nicoliella lavandulae]|uniref:Uncharacterized protein n=1 Tax=Nicoliella lavandulae TaxID=3082954 RepID=A0ABU8SK71_9LACO